MNQKDQLKFNKFKEAVLKRSGTQITNDELFVLINRVTYADTKRYYGRGRNSKFYSRLRYNRYFIKMLEGMGILEQTEFIGIWRVKDGRN